MKLHKTSDVFIGVSLLVELCKTTGLNFTELHIEKLFDCGDNRNHKHVALGLGVGVIVV